MSWLARLPTDVRAYDAALLALAGAFALYGLILRALSGLSGHRLLWLLPVAGALCLVAAAVIHGFAAAVIAPLIPTDAEMYRESMRLRSASLLCLLACGVLGMSSGWVCYRQMRA